jgi:fido (protein-threonine AMPylation protein)
MRVYNNCKTAHDPSLLDIHDVMPSAFTSTDYTLQEINDVMGPDFYKWAGRNNVQYINNTTFSERFTIYLQLRQVYRQAEQTDFTRTLEGHLQVLL